jgi:hypothetical protein
MGKGNGIFGADLEFGLHKDFIKLLFKFFFLRGKRHFMSATLTCRTVSGSTSHATLAAAATACQLPVLVNVVSNVHVDV